MMELIATKEALVEAILKLSRQPTIEDAVAVIKFDTIKTVPALLELHTRLRIMWSDRRLTSWE